MGFKTWDTIKQLRELGEKLHGQANTLEEVIEYLKDEEGCLEIDEKILALEERIKWHIGEQSHEKA